MRFIRSPDNHWILKRHAFRVVFRKPRFRGVRIGEDLDVVAVAYLLAAVDIYPDRHCLLGDSILSIANRFRDLMPFRRDQKLPPHFGEAGTAVFAVKEVENGGHDLISLFELICTISSNLSTIGGPRCELGSVGI